MRLDNMVILIIILFTLSGCSETSYQVFEKNALVGVAKSFNPNKNQERREIYSEDKYIYVYSFFRKCVYGYLTNRDDKPEKVIGWIILSGEDHCIMHGTLHSPLF
jgi:hypothetical protein